VFNDVKLAVHAGADVIVVDGMQCGHGRPRKRCSYEHVGIPTLAALRQAVDALDDLNMRGTVQLVISGGIRSGADVAKALAMGADAVAIGQGVLVALGCNSDSYIAGGEHVSALEDYARLGTAPGFVTTAPHREMSGGRDDAGPGARTAPRPRGGRQAPQELFEDREHGIDTIRARLRQTGRASTSRTEDLVALTVEAAAMAGVPLAAPSWIPGQAGHSA